MHTFQTLQTHFTLYDKVKVAKMYSTKQAQIFHAKNGGNSKKTNVAEWYSKPN